MSFLCVRAALPICKKPRFLLPLPEFCMGRSICAVLPRVRARNNKNHRFGPLKPCPAPPKPLQNRAWRGSGRHLGAILETRCVQDLIFDDFGSILGPPLGPVWGHFGHHFFDVFLKGGPWPPFGPPKHLQNETQKGVKIKT